MASAIGRSSRTAGVNASSTTRSARAHVAAAQVATSPFRVAVTRMSMTLVDNNLRFAGAETQKAAALANLAGKFHHLNMFLESFGNADNTLGSWDGVSDDVGDLPQPNLSSWIGHFDILDAAISPDTWGVFGYRLPWQLTGTTTDGVTVKSLVSDYNNDGRRLLTDKVPQFVEWVARWSSALMAAPYNLRVFYQGSESKGFQSVKEVIIGQDTIRAARNQSWEWDDYPGTAGRADMGIYAYYKYYRQGLQEGAARAGVSWSQVKVVTPYPVIAHQGSLLDGGSADAVTFDSYDANLGAGPTIDFSDMNGDVHAWGWPNKAAAILLAEVVRQLSADGIPYTEWDFGSDFGTFNNDNIPTASISDHDHAYLRAKGHFEFYRKIITQFGYDWDALTKRLPEYYAKAQWQMQLPGTRFVAEELRDDYQASIRAAFLLACYEEGIEYPDMWSPFGRGDQSTDAADQQDPNQWYGGAIVRTVTDNNDHPGSAVVGGGEAQSALGLIDALKQQFPPGTPLFAMQFNEDGWRGLASAGHALVVNEQGVTRALSVDGKTESFAAYEHKLIAR